MWWSPSSLYDPTLVLKTLVLLCESICCEKWKPIEQIWFMPLEKLDVWSLLCEEFSQTCVLLQRSWMMSGLWYTQTSVSERKSLCLKGSLSAWMDTHSFDTGWTHIYLRARLLLYQQSVSKNLILNEKLNIKQYIYNWNDLYNIVLVWLADCSKSNMTSNSLTIQRKNTPFIPRVISDWVATEDYQLFASLPWIWKSSWKYING